MSRASQSSSSQMIRSPASSSTSARRWSDAQVQASQNRICPSHLLAVRQKAIADSMVSELGCGINHSTKFMEGRSAIDALLEVD